MNTTTDALNARLRACGVCTVRQLVHTAELVQMRPAELLTLLQEQEG